ncbi:ERF family protein, partial [Paenibacillus larvae]|nr:ERF family protein [Paenibacillus larvae]MDT2182343.1 ERF family protein [Paenibacillus larvae]MDT2198468.1 ERF family protein [Paenibacillus larvae]MDT2207951.1 ERF family protein [Paenibacillus larvae]
MTLVKKLAEVMDSVKYIQKTGYNSFNNYKYATEAD